MAADWKRPGSACGTNKRAKNGFQHSQHGKSAGIGGSKPRLITRAPHTENIHAPLSQSLGDPMLWFPHAIYKHTGDTGPEPKSITSGEIGSTPSDF